jgi:hypothetical protein
MSYSLCAPTCLPGPTTGRRATIRSFVFSHGHGHTFASRLPDLPKIAAPKHMHRLIDTVRVALDEAISGTTPPV